MKTFEEFINEANEELPGAVHTKLGPKQGRVVISGINTEKYQTDIISAVMAIDSTARLDFFVKTNKIVGVITAARLKDIKKALVNIDKSLEAELKKTATLTKL
jgi:ribosomal protein S9